MALPPWHNGTKLSAINQWRNIGELTFMARTRKKHLVLDLLMSSHHNQNPNIL